VKTNTLGRAPKAITIENAHQRRILPHTAGTDIGAVTTQEPVKIPNEMAPCRSPTGPAWMLQAPATLRLDKRDPGKNGSSGSPEPLPRLRGEEKARRW